MVGDVSRYRLLLGAADAGAPSLRSMRCSSAVASVNWPDWVNRVALRSMSRFSTYSPHPIGKSGLNRGRGMQCSEHGDRSDGGEGKVGRNIVRDAGKAQNIDVQHLTGFTGRFKISARI